MTFDEGGPISVLEVTDVSGQKMLNVAGYPAGATVGQLVDDLLSGLELTRRDTDGRPLEYQARLEREGRHLHASERVGDALQGGDRLVLQPSIRAGSGRR